jgi:two-component system catabolic regulation response regulator CreB
LPTGGLVARPGNVFTREVLLDLVWRDHEASLDRTVDVHIKNIRAKLRAIAPDADPIVTHRGSGYSLREEP